MTVPGSVSVADIGGYDPLAPGRGLTAVPIQVVSTSGACPFFITASETVIGSGTRQLQGPGDSLRYQLYTAATADTVWREIPIATPGETLRNVLNSPNQFQTVNFWTYLPPGQLSGAGTYSESVRVSLYEGTPESARPRLVSSAIVNFNARVLATARAKIDGGGGLFPLQGSRTMLDFGELSAGSTRNFDLVVEANAGYRITLQSMNGGVMKNERERLATPVHYTLTIDGVAVQLGATAELFASGSGGAQRHRGTVTLGLVEKLIAGTYRDEILVTISAR
jgi:spore coat protein U-like protein